VFVFKVIEVGWNCDSEGTGQIVICNTTIAWYANESHCTFEDITLPIKRQFAQICRNDEAELREIAPHNVGD